jgi:hypothetical protein
MLMSDDAKDAGLVAIISSILGGAKRAENAVPAPLAEAPPTVPAGGPDAMPVELPEADLEGHGEESSGAVGAAGRVEPSIELAVRANGKRRLPAEAIADLVLGELRKIDGFPASGVSVTVYGFRNWNAMLTFAPFSTTFRSATRFRQAIPDIVFRLRRSVDLEI